MHSRYIILINTVLIICIGLLVFQIKNVWNAGYTISSTKDLQPKPAKKKSKKARERSGYGRRHYEPIATKNLFRPERTEYRPPKQEVLPEPKAPKTPDPEMVVYGVLIYRDHKQAWVSVKHQPIINERTSKRGKARWSNVKTVTEGDRIEGWKVAAIQPETISLSQGNETREYNLIEPGKPKKRSVPKTTYKKTKTKKRYSRSKAPTRRKRRPVRSRRAPRVNTSRRR